MNKACLLRSPYGIIMIAKQQPFLIKASALEPQCDFYLAFQLRPSTDRKLQSKMVVIFLSIKYDPQMPGHIHYIIALKKYHALCLLLIFTEFKSLQFTVFYFFIFDLLQAWEPNSVASFCGQPRKQATAQGHNNNSNNKAGALAGCRQ